MDPDTFIVTLSTRQEFYTAGWESALSLRLSIEHQWNLRQNEAAGIVGSFYKTTDGPTVVLTLINPEHVVAVSSPHGSNVA